jgi:penicillin-binding protein 1A
VLFFLGVLSILGTFFIISSDLPQINTLKDYNPPTNSKILSKDGELLLDIGLETRDVVAYDKIPKRIIDAFLAAEDDNFFNHQGIDYTGIARAFLTNIKEGRLVQGGSTITQQVAKSFLLTKERTISRKVKDLLLARKIEEKFSKEEILYLYLNQVYLGGGYYGIKAAFKGYFDKELKDASIAEAALVAGLLVAPGRYSPYVNPQFAKRRQNYVIKRMYETGKITSEEYEKAVAESIKMRIRRGHTYKAGHFTDWVRQEVIKVVGQDEFLTKGFKVTTTLDWKLQQKAERAVKDRVKELDKRQGFKGPIKKLENQEEILSYLVSQRSKLMKDSSSYFTFTTEGQNFFEFQESEDKTMNVFNFEKEASSKINERFKRLVTVGNSSEDKLVNFLEESQSYEAVVWEIDDLKRVVVVSIGGTKVAIPESGFQWAHERKIIEDPIYFNPVKTPSNILKHGDVVWVKVEKKEASIVDLIHKDFFKKYKDSSLKNLIEKQKFIIGSLDQEPDAEGALIAIHPNSGDIISLVGGVDFHKSQFNRAIQSSRQPGSAFKPFIYAAALESGYTPSSILMDTPQALSGSDENLNWKPRNYDGEFRGPMTFRNALEISRNIPTVRLVQDLGITKINQFIERFHITADLPRDMSLSLGSFGISLGELTKAYAVFPNNGKAIRMNFVKSITDKYGKSYPVPPADISWKSNTQNSNSDRVSEEESNPFRINLDATQVYDPRLSFVLSNVLKGVTQFGTAAAASRLGGNLAGKTGTTNNYVDALFVGYTSNLVVGTWVGFDDNRTLGYGETGGKAALPIWIDFMSSAISKYGAPEFPIPEGVVSVLINKETGKMVAPGEAGFNEFFVSGTEPGSTNKIFTDQTSQESGTLDDQDYYDQMNQ